MSLVYKRYTVVCNVNQTALTMHKSILRLCHARARVRLMQSPASVNRLIALIHLFVSNVRSVTRRPTSLP